MKPSVSVIVPWRDTGDRNRQGNMLKTVEQLTDQFGDVTLVDDGRTEGPFNRSRAYNRGIEIAGDTEVYIFCEADMLVPFSQMKQAILVAAASPGLVVPFTQYRYLDEEDSRMVISGTEPQHCTPQWTMEAGKSTGAVNVVSALSMEKVGQWDEALEGHGYDDRCMELAFRKACNSPTFCTPGSAYHLWHPMAFAPWEKTTEAARPENFSDKDVAATRRNQERLHLYQNAVTPEDIRHFTAGGW